MAACRSLQSEALANAYLGQGVKAYYGYTYRLEAGFKLETGNNLFNRLVNRGMETYAALNDLPRKSTKVDGQDFIN